MITIDEFMTSDPCTLGLDNSVYDAWEIMTKKHIRHIPITDSDGHLLGLVTQRDILAATEPGMMLQREGTSNDSAPKMADVMIDDVSSIHQSDSLRRAAMYLQSHKYGCLPVVVDDRLVGIITDSDFVTIAINLLEQVELAEEDMGMDPDVDDLDMQAL